MKPVHILNGPNLNLLGTREPDIYGTVTLKDIERLCAERARDHGLKTVFRQTNVEGELVSFIHEAHADSCGIVLNAAAYTHTSIALHDALKTAAVPAIEVHLSNVYRREPFRHHSYISPAVHGVICGFGAQSYVLALDALATIIGSRRGAN